MLPKVHLTSHSRMSGSRWVITPLWLSGSLRPVWYSSVYSCHLFLISSASEMVHTFSVLYCAHLCMKCSLGISNFPKEISSLSHSIMFLYFFSLILPFLSLLVILWNSTFKCVYVSLCPLPFSSLLFIAVCKASQATILPFYITFSWGWFWSLPPIQCHKLLSIVLHTLCLSDIIPWIYLSLPLYKCKGFDLGHTWMV